MKAMVWSLSSILFKKIALYLHHCLSPDTETAAGLRHGVLVEVAHQLLDLQDLLLLCNSKTPKIEQSGDYF